MRRPEGDRVPHFPDHRPVARFALAPGEFEAELVVAPPARPHGRDQRLGLDAAIAVAVRREGPVAALVRRTLLDVDDRRAIGEVARPGIGVGVDGVGRGHVAVVDVDHRQERDRKPRLGDRVVKAARARLGMAEFAGDRHRLPEQVGEAARLRVLRHLAPAAERLGHDRVAAGGIVLVAVGQDRVLGADRRAAEVGRDVGERLEPVDVVAAHVAVGVAEVVEATVGAGHHRGDRDAFGRTGLGHAAADPADQRRRPGRIDELVGELDVPDPDLGSQHMGEILGLGEAIDERVRAQRQRQSHGATPPVPPPAGSATVSIGKEAGLKIFCNT